ncbi:hypothetical protein LF935_16210 [Pectobacterium carotovorum]|uniref:hypothetical protein n=1 Tax=Pectobacterium carotovorum TaxID=554 RepID=UPI001CF10DB9|nr:hypothetical protein [Pectobacterium carotovorum]MCA6971186.1 hypothetical protein [Pectobacterium carotovorum]
MSSTSIIGYHTCQDRGGYDHICRNIPFLSKPNNNQWLTQGYYFWTDSPYWAERWLQDQPRVIGKFTVTLDEEHKWLDLVGNTADQEEFSVLKDVVIEEVGVCDSLSITVNQIITFFREHSADERFSGFFDYIAIKAQDERCVSRIDFIEPSLRNGRPQRARLRLITRQQLCVFEEGKDCIKFDHFYYPEEYQQRQLMTNGSSV